MIEQLPTSTSDHLELRFTGQIGQSDYDDVVIPAIESAFADNDRIRMLSIFDEEFGGFDMGAVWADTQMGVSHWSGFDRIAVVTDVGWMKMAMRAVAPMAPCPIQVFSLSELDEARRWLRESLGSVHLSELGGASLHVKLLGKLDPESIANAQEGLSAHIREQGGLRLLLDLREFDGWQGLSALGAHFGLVRQNAPQAARIAVLGDSAWQQMAQRVVARLLKAEVQYFDEDQFDAAKSWLAA